MALVLLIGLQLAALAVVGALVWLRLDRLTAEVARLREALGGAAQAGAVAAPQRVRVAAVEGTRVTPVEDAPEPQVAEPREHPLQRAARVWGAAEGVATPQRQTLNGFVLAFAAMAPAACFFFDLSAAFIVAAGIVIGGVMTLFALHQDWRAAGWAGAITSTIWALIAFVLGAAQAEPGLFAAALTIAGAAGLAHAHMRRTIPSLVIALTMAISALALSSEIGLVSAAGAAFAALVAVAAIVGAMSLRLETVHLAAFGAALLGLFVLSGQDNAAVWFTPAAAWMGALFLGIAIIRVPQLGARGLALAATGVTAALAAISALHISGHGLADPRGAAMVFVAVAAVIAGVIALTATRRQRGLAPLKLTLWALAIGAFAAISAAVMMALSSPLAALTLALVALGLVALDWRLPNAAWRTLAWTAAGLALLHGLISVGLLLRENVDWSPWWLITLALAAPAALASASAYIASRTPAPLTAGAFEAMAIAGVVLAANLSLRVLASDGALLITPIGFAEAGLHVTIWLTVALLVATRAKAGAMFTRNAATLLLGGAGLVGAAAITFLWLTPHWITRAPTAGTLLAFNGLGFIAPAILFGAHWVAWRARGANLRTRIALGAAAFLTAACVTVEVLQARDDGLPGTDWMGALIGAFVFALALGVNFAPGVTRFNEMRPSYLEENLHRDRRRQVRRQAR